MNWRNTNTKRDGCWPSRKTRTSFESILAVAAAGLGYWLGAAPAQGSLRYLLEHGDDAARNHNPDYREGRKPEAFPIKGLRFADGQHLNSQRQGQTQHSRSNGDPQSVPHLPGSLQHPGGKAPILLQCVHDYSVVGCIEQVRTNVSGQEQHWYAPD